MKFKVPHISQPQEYKQKHSYANDGLIVFDSDMKRFERKQKQKAKIQKAKF